MSIKGLKKHWRHHEETDLFIGNVFPHNKWNIDLTVYNDKAHEGIHTENHIQIVCDHSHPFLKKKQ